MVKVISILLVVGLVVFFVNRAGVHASWLMDAEAKVVLSHWEGKFPGDKSVDLISEYATLPEYDRRLILHYCEPVYERLVKLKGTVEILDYKYRTECQVLISKGWHPKWTIKDGIDYLAGDGHLLIKANLLPH